MAERWGRASYPGAKGVQNCTFTISHGISPGCAVMQIHPQATLPAAEGDLVITDGVGTVKIRDMKLDQIKEHTDSSGKVWSLELNDRRWRWRDLGAIWGCYNQLDPNGKLIPWTIRSPHELCVLCLKAMGETRYILDLPPGLNSAIGRAYNDFLAVGQNVPPTGVNPPINWDGENPAQALQRVADLFGRRVVYDPIADIVSVVKQGFGRRLPIGSHASETPSLKFPSMPDGVQVIGAPTRYQVRLEMEPVGKEWDGSYRPINQLSYAPLLGGSAQVTTYTPTTQGVAAHWMIDFPNQDITFSYEGLAGATAANICDAHAASINAHVKTSPLMVATSAGGVLTITGKNVGAAFDVQGWVLTDALDDETDLPTVDVKQIQQAKAAGPSWELCTPPLFVNVRATDRLTRAQAQALAQQSVWKCYRPTGRDVSGRGPIIVPGYGPIQRRQQLVLLPTKVDQIVPLPEDRRVVDRLGRPIVLNFYNGYSKDMPSVCYGGIAAYISAPNFILTNLQGINTPEGSLVYVQFSTDPVFQVITFANHVYKRSDKGRYTPPVLTLETGVHVRDPDDNQLDSYRGSITFAGGGNRRLAVSHHPDVQVNVTCEYTDAGVIRKVKLLENDAVVRGFYYLEGMTLQYFVQDAQQINYNGIEPISVDGAISQVTWTINNGASTQAARNCESNVWVPPFPARRRAENLRPAEIERLRQGANPQNTNLANPQTANGSGRGWS